MMNNRKKILLIGSELGKGGAERSVSLLSYYLQQQGYPVTLCLLSGKERTRYYPTCDDVLFVDPPDHRNVWGKVKAWQYRIRRIRSIKKEKGIAVSISFLEGPDYINVLTKGKEKVVLSIRGSKVYDKEIAGLSGYIRKKILIPWLYARADEMVCVTEALAREMQVYFGISAGRLKTIYNFYETDRILEKSYRPLSGKEQRIFSKPVIIASGRLHMQKEFDKLIRVYHLLKENTDCRLLILGDGDKKQDLLRLAESLGREVCCWKEENDFEEADIYLMGYQENAFKFYRHSKLFALSSSWEGFPNVMAEALICSIPVVATDCYTGPREILDIRGLPEAPVTQPVATPVGTLLPLLQHPTEEILQYWVNSITYWLSSPVPATEHFTQKTQRFTLEAMLRKWAEVING